MSHHRPDGLAADNGWRRFGMWTWGIVVFLVSAIAASAAMSAFVQALSVAFGPYADERTFDMELLLKFTSITAVFAVPAMVVFALPALVIARNVGWAKSWHRLALVSFLTGAIAAAVTLLLLTRSPGLFGDILKLAAIGGISGVLASIIWWFGFERAYSQRTRHV